MTKDADYHEAAIKYNDGLANYAAELAETLENEIVKKWCLSVSRQHAYHARRHKKQLARLNEGGGDQSENETQTINRSAETGQFVTEEFAEENPETTVEETVDSQVWEPTVLPDTAEDAQPIVESGPDPELAAEPVDAGVGTPETEVEGLENRVEEVVDEVREDYREALDTLGDKVDLTDEEKFAKAKAEAEAVERNRQNG